MFTDSMVVWPGSLLFIIGVCLVAATGCLAEAVCTTRPTKSWLLKASPEPKSVIVLDVSADKAGGATVPAKPGMNMKLGNPYDMAPFYSQAKDALASVACLQGLINRQSAEKVYLTNFPTRWLWDGNDGGEGNASQDILKQGLVPYPLDDRSAELKSGEYAGKQYPALSWLLNKYVRSGRLKLRGKIIAPASTGFQTNGAIAAAITACGFEEALFVSEGILPYLEAEGWDDKALPVIADLRKMSNIEATKWALERYGYRPDVNVTLVMLHDSHGDLCSPAWFDYIVATKTFTFFLVSYIQGPEKEMFREVLVGPDAKDPRFPYGTPIVGGVENQRDCIQTMERLGYCAVYGHFPNASVTSAIPTDPSRFRPADKPDPLPIDPNGAYIAWNEVDGDALDFITGPAFKSLLHDPAAGAVPLGWRVNPLLIDLFPTMFEWYTKIHPGKIEIVASLNDSSNPYTPEGEAGWREMYVHYLNKCNGAIAVVNHFNPWRPAIDKALKVGDITRVPYIIAGHVDRAKPSDFEVRHGTVYSRPGISTEGSIKGKPWDHPDCSELRIAHAIAAIKEHLAAARDGEPCFIMERGWHSTGTKVPTDAKATVERLKADPSIKRKLYFGTPSQVSATFRAYAAKTQPRQPAKGDQP